MEARALVARNLRRLRVERGVSQETLAYEAGIDRAYLGGLEREVHNPTVDLLERLARYLKVPMSEFFVIPQRGTKAPENLRKGRKSSAVRRAKQ